jgi:hypothetical protein
MKTLCWMAILSALSVMSVSAQAPGLQKAKKLAEDGNHREAANAAKALLKRDGEISSQDKAAALYLAVDSLKTLDAQSEAESVIEESAKNFPKDWRVLIAAGTTFGSLDSEGSTENLSAATPLIGGAVCGRRNGTAFGKCSFMIRPSRLNLLTRLQKTESCFWKRSVPIAPQ